MATYFDAEGNEVEAIPVEEVETLKTSLADLTKEKEDILAEKIRLEAGGADKEENFKKVRDAFTENQKKLDLVTKRLNDKEENERTTAKETYMGHFAGEDKEAREKFDAKYAILNMPESTPQEIAARAVEAAKMSGLYKETTTGNPVFTGVFGGSAPFIKPTKVSEDDADNVVNTEKGKSALSAMGVPADYGTKK